MTAPSDLILDLPASRTPILPSAARRRRTLTVGLLILAGCVSYVDRSALSVGNMAIKSDLGLSYAQMGWLLSAFAWAYLVAQIPAGILSDRIPARWLIGGSLIVWSCAQALFGLMPGLRGLFICRFLLGMGEAPLFLAGTCVIVRWFSPRERGGPIGLFNGSAALGPTVAPPLLLAIMAIWGWRGMSISIGAAGIVVAIVWLVYYRDPMEAASPRLAPLGRQRRFAALGPDLAYLLRQRETWVVTAGFVGVIYVTWLYSTWMPAWLQAQYHLTLRQAGLLSVLPQFCGFVGSLVGGVLVDRFAHAGRTPVAACRLPLVVGMIVAACATMAAALSTALVLSVALMALALFAGGAAMACGWTVGTAVVDPDRVATLEAIQNTGGSLGGALAPAVTGVLVDHAGSFAPALMVAGIVSLGSAGIYHFGLRDRHAAPAITG